MTHLIAIVLFALASAAPAWLDLESLTVSTGKEPAGARVEGTLEKGGRFVVRADAKVKGVITPREGRDTVPGWVELETHTFHSDVEAVRPRPPYVKGFRTRDGRFHPDSAEIHR